MVGNCTVMFLDPMSGKMFKTRNLLLMNRVEFLEQLIMDERQYRWDYDGPSLADYLFALRLPVSDSDELSLVIPGHWFDLAQIGWYHGIPLVTIEMHY